MKLGEECVHVCFHLPADLPLMLGTADQQAPPTVCGAVNGS